MQNNLPTYTHYKPSGVQWLGDIPKHWEMKRFRNLFNLGKGLTITKENLKDEGILCVNYGEIHSKYAFVLKPEVHKLKCVDTDYLKKNSNSLLNNGDFVFADTSEDIEGSGNFTHLESSESVFAGYHTIIARPIPNLLSKFLAYEFDSLSFRSQIKSKVKGVKVYSITQSILNELAIWLPPLPEQTAIAQFLDRKTAQIDVVIAQKQRMIELLKERRQILIHQAVTRGLHPDVPMKDSGVEWIGEIPEHWEVKRAKFLFDEIDERSATGDEELLSVSHMTGVTPRSEKNVSMFMSEDYTGSKLCRRDDLIYNIMWAWMGALGVSDRTGIVSPSYAIYRQKKAGTLNSWYFEQLLRDPNYVAHYNRVSTGLHSSRLRFYSNMFFDMKIGFPPIEEQNRIVEYLKTATQKIDTAIGLKEQEIEKLKEYKASLINSVVTGKVKVAEKPEGVS